MVSFISVSKQCQRGLRGSTGCCGGTVASVRYDKTSGASAHRSRFECRACPVVVPVDLCDIATQRTADKSRRLAHTGLCRRGDGVWSCSIALRIVCDLVALNGVQRSATLQSPCTLEVEQHLAHGRETARFRGAFDVVYKRADQMAKRCSPKSSRTNMRRGHAAQQWIRTRSAQRVAVGLAVRSCRGWREADGGEHAGQLALQVT